MFIIYLWVLINISFNVCLCLENSWYSFHDELKDANREELAVTNVTTDEDFKLNYKVKKWTSLPFGPICYSVGLMEKNIVLLISTLSGDINKFNIKSYIKDLDEKPLDAMLLKIRKRGQMEIIMVVAFQEKLKLEWYKISDKGHMDMFWSLPLQQPVIHINAFEMNKKNVLLLSDSSSTVNLYELDIKGDKPTYWELQHLHLSYPADSSIVNNFEYDYFLSIPQKSIDLLRIFKFEENRFLPYKNLTSKKFNSVVSFDIGFETFLAIDGFNAGIFQFTRNGLVMEKIINSNLEGISFWLPVPLSTYRDEIILFAQRELDYSSHKGNIIDIITYNGGKFEEHEDIPCSYFGEHQDVLACLAHGSGIIGASYITIDDKLGLVVPGTSDATLLYMVHFGIKQMHNPKEEQIEKIVKLKNQLEKMIMEQSKEYQALKDLYKQPPTKLSDKLKQQVVSNDTLVGKGHRRDLLHLKERMDEIKQKIIDIKEKVAKIVEKESRKEFNTIVINGRLDIESQGKFGEVEVDEINGSPAAELLEDVVRKNSVGRVMGTKTFTDLSVDKVSFEKVNDVDANELMFNEPVITLNGNISFKHPVDIENIHTRTGTVNDIFLEEEIVDVRKKQEGSLDFENVNVTEHFQARKVNDMHIFSSTMGNTNMTDNLEDELEEDTLVIPQNLSVTNINGENFENFISRLCLTNIKCYVPGYIRINGNVSVLLKEVFTEYLNNLKFPEEYILRDSVPHSNITGKKTFTTSLTANEIRCRGSVNNLDTNQLITLSTNQNVSGKITFNDIHVTEALNVSGEILGEYIHKFLPNPILEDFSQIKANVNFKDLEVEGDVIIENNFNKNNFSNFLNDLVYKDEESATITASKDIPKGFVVKNNFEISSNAINDIKIDSIVTKDTPQILNITLLNGDVSFENLIINGTFNRINITQMNEDLVKLTDEQNISSNLIFDGDLEVEHLEITDKLNDLGIDEYLFTDGDREIEGDLNFEEVEAESIVVEGNVLGNLSGIDLEELNRSYLSYSKNQSIDVPFSIKYSVIENLKAEKINDRNYEEVFGREKMFRTAKLLQEREELDIENVFVNGSIEIDTANGEKMDDVLPRNVLVDENGRLKKNFSIRGNIFTDTIEITKLSGVTWHRYIKQLVFKNESNPVLESPKINFTKGVIVEKLIETQKLNNVSIENILTKEGSQDIVGDVTVKGNVTFKDVEVAEDLNGLDIAPILNYFNVTDGNFIISGDMLFSKLAHIHKLKTHGLVNEKGAADVLSNLIHIDEDIILHHDTIFKDTVNISGNMAIVQRINDIILSDVVPRMVLTTKDAEIWGPVTFSSPVSVLEYLKVEEDLITNTLHHYDLDEWTTSAIYIDQGLIPGNVTLDQVVIRDVLNTQFLNDIDMQQIIPLRTDQDIDYLQFEELKVLNNIPVGNLVNGYNLPEEYGRTVMSHLDQEISSRVVFGDRVIVRENLTVQRINNIDVSKIVTLDTDQNLTGIFNFSSKCRIESDLHMYGLLNGVNASLWLNDGLKIYSPELQKVYDDWAISENFVFKDNVEGECNIGGLSVVSAMNEAEKKRDYKYKVDSAIIDDYKNMCVDVTNLYESAKEQIYKFRYFEDFQSLVFDYKVLNTHYFQYQDYQYLLVSGDNCSSHLLVFNQTTFSFVESIYTGQVSQVISVHDGNDLYLVTNGPDDVVCEVFGTNMWAFTEDNVTLEYNMEKQEVLQESLVPGTFYALNKEGVSEFKIVKEIGVKRYRKWKVSEENVAFVPRGLKTGLALRTGSKIIYLDRTDPLIEDDFTENTDSVIIGNYTAAHNHFLPGFKDGDLVVTRVGSASTRRNLLAVATHEETSVRGRLDFIKIYENPLRGEIFHKVSSYKPSSLISVEYEQGETLLVFLENKRTLQVYEYKGIEGFKHRSSSKIEGSKLFLMTLPIEPYLNERKVLGIIYENSIRLLQSVMLGNQIRSDLKCGL